MRIVLDTNVLVSAMLNPDGAPGAVIRGVLEGRFQLLVDNRIVFEYSDVLARPKFRLNPENVRAFLDYIEHEAEYATVPPVQADFDDPDDVAFYEVAVGANASYLVTGNSRHFPDNPIVKSPREFIQAVLAGERDEPNGEGST